MSTTVKTKKRHYAIALSALLTFMLLVSLSSAGQSTATSPASSQLSTVGASQSPKTIKITGTVSGFSERMEPSRFAMVFTLYKEQTGGSPVWMETQNVNVRVRGGYSAVLGTQAPENLPENLFSGTETFWLGVEVIGRGAQPRIRLARVTLPSAPEVMNPSAVGGNMASAGPVPVVPAATTSVVTVGGQTATTFGTSSFGSIALFPYSNLKPGFIGVSTIFEASTGNVGINTTTPSQKLDVAGSLGIVGNGNGIIFPDGTKLATANPTPAAPFANCVSNSLSVPFCGCSHILGSASVRNGGSCTISGVTNACSAVSNPDPNPGGVNGTSGVCCVCN